MTTTTPAEYQAKLRANVADPGEATRAGCPDCARTFAYRVWPGRGDDDDQDYLDAFLDGLAGLARTTGQTVYGFWAIAPDREPLNDTTPVQLWRANDRSLIFTGPFLAAVNVATQHACPGEGHDGAHVGFRDSEGGHMMAGLMRGLFPLCTRCYTAQERAEWGWQPS